jgi:Lipase (class 3)
MIHLEKSMIFSPPPPFVHHLPFLYPCYFQAGLTVIKYHIDSDQILKKNNRYFIGSVAVVSFFLAILLFVLVIFLHRFYQARRSKLVWSKRRMTIARSAFAVLILQMVNLTCMLASAAYAVTNTCKWVDEFPIIMGYVQWTMWNFMFLMLVALAHNGSLWHGHTRLAKGKSTANFGGHLPGMPEEQGEDAAAAGVANVDSAMEVDGAGNPVKKHHALPAVTMPLALVMDAPFSVHFPKFLNWFLLQVPITMILARFETSDLHRNCNATTELKCGPVSTNQIIYLSLVLGAIVIYCLAYSYFSWRTDKDIKSRSYAEMRFARMVFGVQREQVLPVFLTFTLCAIVLLTIRTGSCWTYVETWLGVVALQAVATCMAGTLSFFFMPKKLESKDEIMNAWLQEFAWTQAEQPLAINRRNAKLARNKKLAAQPMFCIETAIKLLYYSNLVYTIDDSDVQHVIRVDIPVEGEDDDDSEANSINAETAEEGARAQAIVAADGAAINAADGVKDEKEDVFLDTANGDGFLDEGNNNDTASPGAGNIKDALELFEDLTNTEVIYHRGTDTKCMIAWGGTTLVVSFKGTSSFENVLTDLNFLKSFHPPRRTAPITSSWGFSLIHVPVRVHTGFLDAWSTSDYDKKVVERVGEILAELGGPEVVTFMVTGHSLGGALATLASHAFKSAYPAAQITCYTYGQPRVGNRPFAYEYNKMVPDHFAVINGQDPVTRVPKGYYKRVGNRIIIDDLGDIIVRPTYLEMHLIKQLTPKVGDHFLDMYRSSLMRAIKMQFTERRLETGQPGARELSRFVNLDKVLMGVNLDEYSLEDPDLEPMTNEEAAKLSKSSRKMSRTISFNCGGKQMSCGCGGAPQKRFKKHAGASHADHDHDEVVQPLPKETVSSPKELSPEVTGSLSV